ncbi:MAG: FKBP-type peptidyl-prolyl cis-trans isomerase [Methanomassiliicoccaceae archaeon]|jgi:FKBP-type peptidyl-prolyl cis-trans isomerase SlyD|nr:FKBP-type peptidyl-prolyl cis-trans isomerase [Methanomassiliicoccaceae archaeon]
MAAAKKGSIGKGDLVFVDYDAFIADNGKLFDTTMAESAKNAGFFDEKFNYSPEPVLLGSGKMFEALEKAIEGAAVGKEAEVTIPFADAAGARDPKLVEIRLIKEFHKQEINPYPGLEVQLGNKRGTVMSVGAGRVRVDFNNPLAGKDLIYKFTVREVVVDKIEKAKAVVKMTIGTSDGFEFTITEEKVTVILPELTKFDQSWPVARFSVVAHLRKVAEVDTIEFVEVWSLGEKKEKKKEEKKDGEPAEEKPAAKPKAPKKEAKAEDGAVKKEAKASASTVKKETAKPKADKASVNKATNPKNMGKKEK